MCKTIMGYRHVSTVKAKKIMHGNNISNVEKDLWTCMVRKRALESY